MFKGKTRMENVPNVKPNYMKLKKISKYANGNGTVIDVIKVPKLLLIFWIRISLDV